MQLQCKLEDQNERHCRDKMLRESIQLQEQVQKATQETISGLASKLDAVVDSCSQKQQGSVEEARMLQGVHTM